jgi:hypothetical protein
MVGAGKPGGAIPKGFPDSMFKRDARGNVISETLIGEGGVVALEMVQTPSATPLPLSTDDLRALVNDPRVGIQTDAATLARSRHIPSYLDDPPAIRWGGL